jgi:hypothetical protein
MTHRPAPRCPLEFGVESLPRGKDAGDSSHSTVHHVARKISALRLVHALITVPGRVQRLDMDQEVRFEAVVPSELEVTLVDDNGQPSERRKEDGKTYVTETVDFGKLFQQEPSPLARQYFPSDA